MRAKEFILKEEILNEVDWNKVKSAILGGVLSLSTLGAPNLQAKDIANMTGEEIKQYVIQKGVIKDKQQMTDLVKELDRVYGNTSTATTAPTTQPTATPVAKPAVVATPAAQPTKNVTGVEVNPISPTATPVAKPPAAPLPTSVTKVEPKADSNISNKLSNFSIKGLRFGMTLGEVAKLTGGDISSYADWGNAINRDFSIAGLRGWQAVGTTKGYNIGGNLDGKIETESRLGGLSGRYYPFVIDQVLPNFTKKYGKPIIKNYISQNNLGAKVNNYTATWDIGDAVITMTKYSNMTEGEITITGKSYDSELNAYYSKQAEKKSRDF